MFTICVNNSFVVADFVAISGKFLAFAAGD
jgi:hypothetical protein